jgi:hypothetical protein
MEATKDRRQPERLIWIKQRPGKAVFSVCLDTRQSGVVADPANCLINIKYVLDLSTVNG